jgi:hypothetical protein
VEPHIQACEHDELGDAACRAVEWLLFWTLLSTITIALIVVQASDPQLLIDPVTLQYRLRERVDRSNDVRPQLKDYTWSCEAI